MKGSGVAVLVLICTFLASAQPSKLDDLVSKIKAKGYSSEIKLLRKTLNASHKEFLKNYKAYSGTEEVFSTGNFDCLSGTMILSTIFDRLNFSYKIYETNYHIFLVVSTSEGEALVETTDKNNGLITNKTEIENRFKTYKDFGQGSDMYLSKLSIFNEVNREQMQGLLLFNKAVSRFLQNDLINSFHLLLQAKESYDNPRIIEFSKALIKQIKVSELEEQLKEELINKLTKLNPEQPSLVAM